MRLAENENCLPMLRGNEHLAPVPDAMGMLPRRHATSRALAANPSQLSDTRVSGSDTDPLPQVLALDGRTLHVCEWDCDIF